MGTVASRQRFALDIPLDRIQTVRLCGALLESEFDVYFPRDRERILQHLSKHFSIGYHVGVEGIPVLQEVSVLHKEPLCKIGTLQRPLILPNQMVAKCRSKWDDARPIRFLFCGLLTERRKRCFNAWVRSHFGKKEIFARITERPHKLLRRILHYLADPHSSSNSTENHIDEHIGLHILSSTRGREFPIKAWDDDYYRLLSRSRFVLCPDGDFTWTYRFFEAVLCGAIPIVQHSCSIYAGFEYFCMKQPLQDLVYSEEIAERNAARAKHMLTLPPECLNDHLSRMLRHA